MTFEALLPQAMALRQRLGRGSYRALKRQCDLDEAYADRKFQRPFHAAPPVRPAARRHARAHGLDRHRRGWAADFKGDSMRIALLGGRLPGVTDSNATRA